MPEISLATPRMAVHDAMIGASRHDTEPSLGFSDRVTGVNSDVTGYGSRRGRSAEHIASSRADSSGDRTVSARAGGQLAFEDRRRIAGDLVIERTAELAKHRIVNGRVDRSSTLSAREIVALQPVYSPFELKGKAAEQALNALTGGNAEVRQSIESSLIAPAARRRLQNIATMLDVARRSGAPTRDCDGLAKEVRDLVLKKGLGANSPFVGYNGKANGSTRLAQLEDKISKLVTKEAFRTEVDRTVARVAAAQADYVEARLGARLSPSQRQAVIDNGGIMSERAKSALKSVLANWNEDSGMNRVFLLEILLDAERLQRALSVPMHEPAAHDVTDAGGEHPARMPDDGASPLPEAQVPETDGRDGGMRNGATSPYGPYNKNVFAPTINVICGGASDGGQHVGKDDGETPHVREQDTNAVVTGRTVDPPPSTKADEAVERFDAESIIDHEPEREDARSIVTCHGESEGSEDCDDIFESLFGSRADDAYGGDEMDDSAEPNEGPDTKAGANSERDYGFGSNGMPTSVGTQTTSADLQRREVGTQTEPVNPPIAHPQTTTAPTLAATVKLVRTRPATFEAVSGTPYARLSSGFADPLRPRAGLDLRVGYALKNIGSYLKQMDRGETAEGFGAKRSSFSAPKSPERVRDDGASNNRVEAEVEHAVSHGSKHGANGSQSKEDRHGEVVGSYLNSGTLNIISTRNTRAVDLFPRKEGGQSAPRIPVKDGYAHKHVGSYLDKQFDKVVTTEGAQALSKHWRY
ncbi:hypothetical protein QZM52_25875 [Burkholderia metallica]|uniref:Uncharacterized protein n=1 Tax=Burkholderia metallica TaxID=488729 RepID=A0ABT8PHW5_9BURK|nr:hypothetical protein [Burkholderia metallica]MDN7934710.1 hypothetical protein [Burkholderia metallica]